MMRTQRQDGERGFALMLVVMIVALGMTGALVLFGMVNVDLDIVGSFRRVNEARDLSVAGGGQLIAALNQPTGEPQERLDTSLDPSQNNVLVPFELDETQREAINAQLGGQLGDSTISYDITPLRLAQGSCSGRVSGFGRVQSIWYEARVRSRLPGAADEVRIEFCRPIAGGVNPRIRAGR